MTAYFCLILIIVLDFSLEKIFLHRIKSKNISTVTPPLCAFSSVFISLENNHNNWLCISFDKQSKMCRF